jgi:hypothetical protein
MAPGTFFFAGKPRPVRTPRLIKVPQQPASTIDGDHA